MNVGVYLADFAQGGPGEKLNALGLGWSKAAGVPPALAVVVLLDLDDRDDPSGKHTIDIRLLDKDGELVEINGEAIAVNAQVQLDQDAEGPRSTVPLAFNVVQLGLEPGEYTWQVAVDDRHEPTWRRSFAILGRAAAS